MYGAENMVTIESAAFDAFSDGDMATLADALVRACRPEAA